MPQQGLASRLEQTPLHVPRDEDLCVLSGTWPVYIVKGDRVLDPKVEAGVRRPEAIGQERSELFRSTWSREL